MRASGVALVIACCLAGCKPPEEATVKALVGAVLIDGTGGPPVSNSVLLISGPRIAAVSGFTNIVIPQGAEEIDGSKRYMAPMPVDICVRNGAEVYSMAGGQKLPGGVLAGSLEADTARGKIDEFHAQRRAMVVIDGLAAAAEEAAIEQARKDSLPVFARAAKRADVERLVAEGVTGFIGMIGDVGPIDEALVARLRDLRVIWAPALVECDPAALDRAQRNTRQLAQGGVPIALAGAPMEREMELLAAAGMRPGDVIAAATRNGAQALGRSDLGTLQAGKRADLLLLPGNPLEDIHNMIGHGREMVDGVWLK